MATTQRFQIHNQAQGLPISPTLPTIDFNDNNFFAVYCFIKNFVGVTGCTSAVIDSKIEEAMDIVKRHLMYTMREEVEVLKERIVVLVEKIKQLEMENDFLKSNVGPEVLRALNTAKRNANAGPEEEITANEDLEVATITANAHFYKIQTKQST